MGRDGSRPKITIKPKGESWVTAKNKHVVRTQEAREATSKGGRHGERDELKQYTDYNNPVVDPDDDDGRGGWSR